MMCMVKVTGNYVIHYNVIHYAIYYNAGLKSKSACSELYKNAVTDSTDFLQSENLKFFVHGLKMKAPLLTACF